MSGIGTRDGRAVGARIEALLIDLVAGVVPAAPRQGPGRPPILPATILWSALIIGVLRGAMSQAAIWRLVTAKHLWRAPRISVTDEAVYKRLAAPGPSPLGTLFTELTTLLIDRISPWADDTLASFATDVVVIDETTLDPVARSLPQLRGERAGSDALLPGKIAGLYDLRLQLWRTIQLIAHPHQNEKVAARGLVEGLRPGRLILADLGYFGFEWCDELTDAGHWWISRDRKRTSMRVEHILHQEGETLDALVWLGAYRADRAKHLVRFVRFAAGGTMRSYFTNVCDPTVLSMDEITRLYARRWDIELAVNLVKSELGLHLLWSAKPTVIHHQIWAVLIIAQILQALRVEIAARAGVDVFDVSMALLVRHLPEYAATSDDPIAEYIADGVFLKFIRPSRRIQARAPTIPWEAYRPPPADLVTTQTPRYAGRKCGPERTNIPH